MSKDKILKRGKIKNPELLKGKGRGRGGGGGGGTTPTNGSWTEGMRPHQATKLALKSSTSLTKPNGVTFQNTVKAIKRNQKVQEAKNVRKPAQVSPNTTKTQSKKTTPKKTTAKKIQAEKPAKVSTIKKATTAVKKVTGQTMRKGLSMLKNAVRSAPKNTPPKRSIKKSGPKH